MIFQKDLMVSITQSCGKRLKIRDSEGCVWGRGGGGGVQACGCGCVGVCVGVCVCVRARVCVCVCVRVCVRGGGGGVLRVTCKDPTLKTCRPPILTCIIIGIYHSFVVVV